MKKELISGIICGIFLVVAAYFLKSISEVRCIAFIAISLFVICEVVIYYQGKVIELMRNCDSCSGHSSLTCSGCKNYSNWELRK